MHENLCFSIPVQKMGDTRKKVSANHNTFSRYLVSIGTTQALVLCPAAYTSYFMEYFNNVGISLQYSQFFITHRCN